MQWPEASECNASKNPPTLATSLESQRNESANSTEGGRTIRCYASQRIFPGNENPNKAQSRNHAPNSRSARQSTSDQTDNAKRQATKKFRVTPAHDNAAQASTDTSHIRSLFNSKQRGSQLRNRCNGTPTCHVHRSATSVWPTLQCLYRATHCDDNGPSTHDRLHVCLWNATHADEAHIPARNATREMPVDLEIQDPRHHQR